MPIYNLKITNKLNNTVAMNKEYPNMQEAQTYIAGWIYFKMHEELRNDNDKNRNYCSVILGDGSTCLTMKNDASEYYILNKQNQWKFDYMGKLFVRFGLNNKYNIVVCKIKD